MGLKQEQCRTNHNKVIDDSVPSQPSISNLKLICLFHCVGTIRITDALTREANQLVTGVSLSEFPTKVCNKDNHLGGEIILKITDQIIWASNVAFIYVLDSPAALDSYANCILKVASVSDCSSDVIL